MWHDCPLDNHPPNDSRIYTSTGPIMAYNNEPESKRKRKLAIKSPQNTKCETIHEKKETIGLRITINTINDNINK